MREYRMWGGTREENLRHTFRLLDTFSGLEYFKLDFSYCWDRAESPMFRRLTRLKAMKYYRVRLLSQISH